MGVQLPFTRHWARGLHIIVALRLHRHSKHSASRQGYLRQAHKGCGCLCSEICAPRAPQNSERLRRLRCRRLTARCALGKCPHCGWLAANVFPSGCRVEQSAHNRSVAWSVYDRRPGHLLTTKGQRKMVLKQVQREGTFQQFQSELKASRTGVSSCTTLLRRLRPGRTMKLSKVWRQGR